MGKAAALHWIENRYLGRHLRGRGLEIGALWRRFPVHPKARVFYVDRLNIEDLKFHHADVQGEIVRPDFIADAADLPVAKASLDFLIASHVLEHLPFPLAALDSWYNALGPGGKLLLKVPDKRYTFDVHRSRTPLSRLISEYEHPESFDWRSRLIDWEENVNDRKPDETWLAYAVPDLIAAKFNIHFQVWIDEDLLEIIDFTRRVWSFDWDVATCFKARFYRKEVAVLLTRP